MLQEVLEQLPKRSLWPDLLEKISNLNLGAEPKLQPWNRSQNRTVRSELWTKVWVRCMPDG